MIAIEKAKNHVEAGIPDTYPTMYDRGANQPVSTGYPVSFLELIMAHFAVAVRQRAGTGCPARFARQTNDS